MNRHIDIAKFWGFRVTHDKLYQQGQGAMTCRSKAMAWDAVDFMQHSCTGCKMAGLHTAGYAFNHGKPRLQAIKQCAGAAGLTEGLFFSIEWACFFPLNSLFWSCMQIIIRMAWRPVRHRTWHQPRSHHA